MFEKYREYLQYRRSILAWAQHNGYQASEVAWVYPWQPMEDAAEAQIIVVFDRQLSAQGYITIYQTKEVCILERATPPLTKLRFGIPPELLQELLVYVRETATRHLHNEEPRALTEAISADLHPYLEDDYIIDVLPWVDGALRGSQAYGTGDGPNPAAKATIQGMNDPRFKPVTLSELDRTVFEIVIIPDLWVILPKIDYNRHAIHTMTTRCMEAGEFRSMYVPSIANKRNYGSPHEYYGTLVKKGGVLGKKNVYFEQAPTVVAIETPERQCLLLNGVYPQVPRSVEVTDETIDLIAEHMMRCIDTDGFSPLIRPAEGEEGLRLHLARLGFIYFALTEYSMLRKNERALDTVKKMQDLLRRLYKHSSSVSQNSLIAIYTNQAMACLGEEWRWKLTPAEEAVSYRDPLHFTQYLRQKIMHPTLTTEEAVATRDAIVTHFQRWCEVRDQQSPVLYADLLPLLLYSGLTAEHEEFANWLRSKQAPDGSFTGATRKTNTNYQRGVAKLAESAAACRTTQDIAQNALTFIRQMQYTDDTLYHIPIKQHDLFRGGFRFNAWDRDLWLDGSAHALLTELRLGHFSTYEAHLQTCLSKYVAALAAADS